MKSILISVLTNVLLILPGSNVLRVARCELVSWEHERCQTASTIYQLSTM